MANSIEIEIIANFKDNATDQVKELNAELDKLEKRNVSVSVSVADRATQMAADIESKLSRVDGSKATEAIDKVTERADKIVNADNEISVTANTTAADNALNGLESRINNINRNASVDVNTQHSGDGFMLNGSWVPVSGMSTGGYENNTAERIADELTTNAARRAPSVSAGNYDPTAMEAIEEYASLKGQIAEYGIKLTPGADLDTMRNAVFEYEDRHFATKPANEPPELSTPQIESTGMEQGADVTNTYLNSLGEGMKSVTSKVASRFMGARMLYKGINEAASDFQAAFEADNDYDSQRSLARGATKAGLMGTGAVIGSLVGMPMLGAGAGALISNLFGDDLADILSGMHKSADEIKQDRLDELFGDIAMSASDLEAVASNMLGSFQSRISEIHQQSFSTGYSMRDNVFSEYGGIWELGSKLQLKNNLLLKNTDADLKAFQTQVSSYMDDIKDTIAQEMYNAFMNNDDLFGYDNWDTSALSDKYSELFKDVTKQSDELSKYLKEALSDGQLTTDEVDHINGVVHTTQGKVEQSLPDEGQVKTDTYSFLAQYGMLSKGSYDELVEGLTTDYSNNILNLANERSLAIANGMDENSANAAFWGKANAQTESSMQIILNTAQSKYGDDYDSALGSAWRGDNGTGLHSFYEEGTQYDRYLSSARNSLQYYQEYGDPSYLRGAKGQLSGIKELITGSFDNVGIEEQGAMSEAYEGMQPMLQLVEGQAKAVKAAGGDISPYIDEMMEMYQTGAMGGGAIAKDKYAAMLMSSKQEYVDLMNDVFGGDSELMSQFMGENFTDMWELLHGGTDGINNQADEQKQALEDSAQKVADAAADGTEKQKAALEQSGEETAEAAADGTEKIVDAVNDNAEKVEDATKDTADKANELGENILDAVSESLDKIDADMLSDSNIGEKLMSAIGEGIGTMDFENIEIGEQLMSAIGEAVDTMDFEDVDIGEKIMSAITEAVDTMDFSEVSVGESVMDGISQAIDTMDFEGISIGESIMAAIVEAVDTMDLSEIGIGESIMDGIGAAVDTMDFSGLDIGAKIMDGINASVEAADISGVIDPIKSDLEALNAIECTPNIEAQDNASSVISSVSSALSDLDGQSATVTVNIQQNGSLPTGFHFASGTPNAPEGLGWVNDDGTADPRELIEHNGQFMMYEGRDVLAPLSKGDRVFTSAQTKDILAGKGIPHFAEGVNNEVIANNRETIGSGSSGASVSIDGLNINITIEGNSNGNVVEEIRQRSGEIAEIVTAEIQRHLSASFANASGGDD